MSNEEGGGWAGNRGQNNGGRNGGRGDRGGRGGRRRRGGQRWRGRGARQNQDTTNYNTTWSNLNPDYQRWLRGGGLAANPTEFGNMTHDRKAALYKDFTDAEAAKAQAAEAAKAEVAKAEAAKAQAEVAKAQAAKAQAEAAKAQAEAAKAEAAQAKAQAAAPVPALPDHYASVLLDMAVRNMEIGWEKISENRTTHESQTVRDEAIRFYGLHSKNTCQILGTGTKHVQNAHIWPYNNKENLVLCDLYETDIDNPKNVLRLHQDIEYHFDRMHLTFVPDGDGFTLKILDPAVRASPIRDAKSSQPNTIGALEGKQLTLNPPDGKPWRRLLGTHSILAHLKARKNGNIESEDLSTAEVNANELMKFSLDDAAQERIRFALSLAND